MADYWRVIDASEWELAGVEHHGQQPHHWYRHPSEPRTWLFKPSRSTRHRAASEDVVEKLACEIAQALGVPSAKVELAVRHGVSGALVEDARPSHWSLQHGAALMGEVVDGYDPQDKEHIGHEPLKIQQALVRFAAPPTGALPGDFSAFDTFAGYLILDALIAHVDRHDRNWAVLIPPPGDPSSDALCPSYDHAASLCSTLDEDRCAKHLEQGTVGRWAEKGSPRKFEHLRGTRWSTLVTFAADAVRLCRSDVRTHWQDRLTQLDEKQLERVVASAPAMSDTTRRFLVELMMVNRRRLLREIG